MTIQNQLPTMPRRLLRGKKRTDQSVGRQSVGLELGNLLIGKTFPKKPSLGWQNSNAISNTKMFHIQKDVGESCGMLGEERVA